mmetsp:Transcript_9116/g.23921  ORF Transcript_9116/g.23921 Transcript_9116/m.23921 type:complete len:257 (-) Transcript_9116:590-1360(-)
MSWKKTDILIRLAVENVGLGDCYVYIYSRSKPGESWRREDQSDLKPCLERITAFDKGLWTEFDFLKYEQQLKFEVKTIGDAHVEMQVGNAVVGLHELLVSKKSQLRLRIEHPMHLVTPPDKYSFIHVKAMYKPKILKVGVKKIANSFNASKEEIPSPFVSILLKDFDQWMSLGTIQISEDEKKMPEFKLKFLGEQKLSVRLIDYREPTLEFTEPYVGIVGEGEISVFEALNSPNYEFGVPLNTQPETVIHMTLIVN